ncbi:hypothetical protein [Methylococcus mesophilus]|uniref:hypothetical protein n=1 Tax=Methylococcus mesophilus TaxID=2993564 RepID=UPI00224B6B46|nr:hypothetical protein [Methylococcus mesophilus]UZR29434.1 hypothetical protein OOT43_02025 [Methylococcus mesophilus]
MRGADADFPAVREFAEPGAGHGAAIPEPGEAFALRRAVVGAHSAVLLGVERPGLGLGVGFRFGAGVGVVIHQELEAVADVLQAA